MNHHHHFLATMRFLSLAKFDYFSTRDNYVQSEKQLQQQQRIPLSSASLQRWYSFRRSRRLTEKDLPSIWRQENCPWWMATVAAAFIFLVFGFDSAGIWWDGTPTNAQYYHTSPESLYYKDESNSFQRRSWNSKRSDFISQTSSGKKRYNEDRFTSWGPGS